MKRMLIGDTFGVVDLYLISNRMAELSMNQAELCRVTRIPQPTLSNILRGLFPPHETQAKIAEALGYCPDAIFCYVDGDTLNRAKRKL